MKNLALQVMTTLKDNEYEASLIGGSTRNELHNRFHNDTLPVKDYDIVTNASYEDVSRLFDNVNARGEQFKVAVVKIPFSKIEFEVAQYRGESYPEEGSLRPSEVHEVETLQEDVLRRDFTMNGIAQDINGNIIDYVGGVEDIKNKVIRAIGNPDERFAEDPLRMLRAIRFVAQLGYDIESKTKDGIKANLYRLRKIPHERVKEEINKLIKGRYVVAAFQLMKELEIHKYPFYNSILKKEVTMFASVLGMEDQKYHNFESYEDGDEFRTLVDVQGKELSLTDLYLVIYANVSVEKALNELNNMMFLNNDEIFKVMLLVKHHHIVKFTTNNALVRLVKDVGEQRGQTYLEDILDTYRLIYNVDFVELKDAFTRPLFIHQLPINGKDVIALGERMGVTQKGKWIHQALQFTQFSSILGKSVYLDQVLQVIFEQNNISYRKIRGGDFNEKHRIINFSS